MLMSMWSLRWHFTNKSVAEAPYTFFRIFATTFCGEIKLCIKSNTVCHTAGHYGEEYDDWNMQCRLEVAAELLLVSGAGLAAPSPLTPPPLSVLWQYEAWSLRKWWAVPCSPIYWTTWLCVPTYWPDGAGCIMLSVCLSVCVCVRPCVPGRKHSRSACPPLLVVYLTTRFQTFRKHFSGKFCAAAVWDATALWDSWDASPPTCENLGTKCIWSPPTLATFRHFCRCQRYDTIRYEMLF